MKIHGDRRLPSPQIRSDSALLSFPAFGLQLQSCISLLTTALAKDPSTSQRDNEGPHLLHALPSVLGELRCLLLQLASFASIHLGSTFHLLPSAFWPPPS